MGTCGQTPIISGGKDWAGCDVVMMMMMMTMMMM
jgi:hypothetical protein